MNETQKIMQQLSHWKRYELSALLNVKPDVVSMWISGKKQASFGNFKLLERIRDGQDLPKDHNCSPEDIAVIIKKLGGFKCVGKKLGVSQSLPYKWADGSSRISNYYFEQLQLLLNGE